MSNGIMVAPWERFRPQRALHWRNSEPTRHIAVMMLVPSGCFQDSFHRQRNPTCSDQIPEEPNPSATLTVTSDSFMRQGDAILTRQRLPKRESGGRRKMAILRSVLLWNEAPTL